MKRPYKISRELVNEIEKQHDLKITSIDQLEGGYANFNFKLKTKQETYFLRIHDLITDINSIRQEHKLINFLLKNNFKTARINLTKTNQTYFIIDECIVALFDWIDGSPVDIIDMSVIRQAARTLAKFHKIASEFCEDIPKWGLNINQSPKEIIRHQLVGFLDIIFEDMPWEKSAYMILEIKKNRNQFEKYMLEIKPYLETVRDDIHNLVNTIKFIEAPIIIHGDYWKNNLLFKDRKLVGVIDFDTARPSPAKMELVKGALEFADFNDLDRFKAFLDEYNKITPVSLTNLEIRFFVEFMLMWQLGQDFKRPLLNNRNATAQEFKNIKKFVDCLKNIDSYL